ncbi:MAG: ABC transporter ATP-binding protein [Acidimicrobiia bacterium]|nr:ABC transporter ATP-binding protein [Acidimicrobiia bacterium]
MTDNQKRTTADALAARSERFPLFRIFAGLLNRRIERVALVAIATTATLAALAETLVLVIISLAALRLASDSITAVDLPFGIPVDELATSLLITLGLVALAGRLLAVLSNSYISARLAESVTYRWRHRIFSAFQNAPWTMQQEQAEGYLQTLSQTYVYRAGNMIKLLLSAMTAGISFSMFVVAAVAVDPLAAVGLIVFGGFLFFIFRPLTRVVRKFSIIGQRSAKEYVRLLEEASAMSLEHRVLGSDQAMAGLLDEQLQTMSRAGRRQRTVEAMTPNMYSGVGYIAILLGIAIATRQPPGEAAALGVIVLMMLRSIGYGNTFQATTQSLAASQEFARELLDAVREFENAALSKGTLDAGAAGQLELRNAALGYGSVAVLGDVNLTIAAGESVGIIGPSGGGKSTLALTLLGLLEPVSGQYLVDGQSSEKYVRNWWHRNMSFVPQQPLLFDGTVAENIAIYRSTVSPDDIKKAAVAAHLGPELKTWTSGLDHTVGPRGGRLSGGQRQRVCIARALVGEPSVLVLDEPTSALDTSAEDSITNVLRDLRHQSTLIVVAHRLSTLEFCDRVLVVDDGRITEIGNGASIQRHSNTEHPILPADYFAQPDPSREN